MLEKLEAEVAEYGKYTCAVGKWISVLDNDDKLRAKRMMIDTNIPSSFLHKKFREYGADFGITTFKKHRRGECSCPRPGLIDQ
jgi:hypothetical protein